MADLHTSFRFPRPILKQASTWRDRASRIPSTRLSLSGRRVAPVLHKLSIGLAPIGLAVALIALPALAADAGWLGFPNAAPGPGFAGPWRRPSGSAALQVSSCPTDPVLIVGSGVTCSLAAGTHTYQSLTIQGGGTIIALGDPALGLGVTIVAQDLTIEAGGWLSADQEGYPGGGGPGAGMAGALNLGAGGGGHGGFGGDAFQGAAGGAGYGDALQPSTLGSGGGNNNDQGGSGGGAIHLVVSNTFSLDGLISADGGHPPAVYAYNPGGGAGGSIWIEAANLTGAGTIRTNGALGAYNGPGTAGAGAGGRTALDYITGDFSGSLESFGGSPGTVYLASQDELRINNNGFSGRGAVLEEDSYDFNTIRLISYAKLTVLGAGSSISLDDDTVLGDDTRPILAVQGTVSAPAAFTVGGYALDVQGVLLGVVDLTLAPTGGMALHAYTPLHSGPYSFDLVTVAYDAALTLVSYDDGDADYTDDLPFELQANNVTVELGGGLGADGGYSSGRGPGAGTSGALNLGAGGGGHGGIGGTSEGGKPGGVGYGSVFQPTTLGSGGGNNAEREGGAGGGAIHLVVSDTLTLSGWISADGESGRGYQSKNAGGGAGGSIWIQAGTMAGDGSISADGDEGGSYDNGFGGGGAGGRVAIDSLNSTFTGTISANGCEGEGPFGGPGTVYHVLDNRLVVDSQRCSGQTAILGQYDYSFDTIQLIRYGNLTVLGLDSTLALENGTVAGDGSATLAVQGTVSVPDPFTIAGFTLDVRGQLNGAWDLALVDQGGLVLREHTPLRDGPYAFGGVTVAAGSTLTLVPFENGDADYSNDTPFELQAIILMIEADGRLSSDALGYPGGRGPGAGAGGALNQGAGGGGHGGVGGAGATGRLGGPGYGNVHSPTTLGSGGGNNTGAGGAGGGAIHLIIEDTLLVDGAVSANGGDAAAMNGRNPGGGAGGSIWIQAGNLAGGGSIMAIGGKGGAQGIGQGGSGAGGRIVLDYIDSTFGGSVWAHGCNGLYSGGPGTVHIPGGNRLIVDNQGCDGPTAVLEQGDYSFDTIQLNGYGHLTLLGQASTLLLGSDMVEGDGTATLAVQGVVNAPQILDIRNYTLDVQGELAGAEDLHVGDQAGLILYAETPLYGGTYYYNEFTVEPSGKLILVPHDDGDSDYSDDSRFELDANRIAISAGGVVSSDGLGYPSGMGPGAGAYNYDNGASGAGHGGTGGAGNGQPVSGAPYDSVFAPTAFGSGGGTRYAEETCGGAGGGAIYLFAGESFTLDGQLTANGSPGAPGDRGCGGGSGGSLWIETPSLSGGGLISANGGAGSGNSRLAGGGAGGRISLDADTSSFSGTAQAFGGNGKQYGGPGTVYLAAEDKLIVDNDGHDGASAGLIEGDYDFESIALSGFGHLEVGGTNSTMVLKEMTVFGDGTATLTPFGTISTPASFSITDFTLEVLGELAGVTDVSVGNQGGLILHARTPLHGSGPYEFGGVTVAAGGALTLVPYDSGEDDYTNDSPFELTSGSLTIGVGGLITSDGLGYGSQRGPGAGRYSYDAGASGAGHGGAGGAGRGQAAAGGTYGSALIPVELGSGGGSRYSEATCGGSGGGAIHLVVAGSVTIEGRLSADGLDGAAGDRGCGGGSGGSVWIEADTFTGNGTMTVNGGNGSGVSWVGGGGGGGRLALSAQSVVFNGTVQALGGGGFVLGGDGTVYLGKVDPVLSTVVIAPPTVTADGVSEATVTVTLKNAFDLPVPDAPVEIALASGGAAYLNDFLVSINAYVDIGTTGSDGVATGTIRATTLGVRTVRARSDQEIIGALGSVSFVAGAVDATQSFVDVATTQAAADGLSSITVIVTARDQFSNPIEGLPVEISATGSAAVVQPTELTNSLGHTSGSITDTVAEAVTVTALINGVLVDDEASARFIGADLTVGKTALAPSNYDGLSSTHALAGGTITYTIEVSNQGRLNAADVEATDTLPAGLTFTTEDNGYPFQANGQTLTWQVGSIPVSESVSLEFEAGIAADVLGIVTNTVSTTTSTTEGDLADNSADLDTTVELPRPAMAVSPSSPTMPVLKGETSSLAATVRNTGAALMTGVTVAPPPNISWVSVDPSVIGDLAPLGGAAFTIHASPPAEERSGYYRDYVTVTDDFGNTRKIALIVRVTEPQRGVEVTIENDQGDLVQGATLLLVRQVESVVVTEGVVETYHESAQKTTPASGRMSFAGLEIGDYDYTVIAADHQTATGAVTIVGGAGTQEVTLSLTALGRIGLSPSEPVLGVVRGQINSTAITLTNLGAGPLTGLAIAPPPSILFVTLGLPDPQPTLQPGESMQFLILAGPAADQAGDIFQGYVTATADDGLTGLLALTVQLTSDAVRDAEVNVVDSQDQAVTGGGSITLIQQKLTTVFVEGETKTLNQQFTGQLDPNGRASFPGLEPGAYNFIASANGFTKETGEIVIQPGTGVQVETVAARIDPFSYSWSVVPIEQGYDITLTMTFDVTTPDPVLALPEVCWALDGGPTAETIKVFNPSGIALNIDALSASLPGASIQIGSFPSVIGSREWRYIPVTATKTGSPATGSAEASFSWDAAPDTFVTFTFNPSSHTSPAILPAITYTKDFEIQPVVFDPATIYTLAIGQPGVFDWLSLAASPSGPMTWTSGTRINVRLTAGPREFLAQGVYTDSAPITVTGSDGSLRQGTLDFTITQTADGTLIHTNFTLGEIPTVHRQATASGIIRSDECTEWEWSSGGGPEPTLIAHVSGPSASFPGQGGPVYDIGHQQIRLEISQKVMMEGESFKADLDITNTSASPIENVSVHIRFTGEDGLDESGFDLIPNTPTGLGTIGVGHKASQTWFIQPSNVNATSQNGELFRASAAITYTYQGVTETFYTVPEQITVYPAPDLVISYQIPLPTTPCMVFPLKVTIHNRGRGPARDLRFSTAQPRLLDSFSGQPIAFWITGTTLNGVDMENALILPLGDLPAGESAVIVWTIESSRPGRFVEFTSDYRQANYLGVPLSPLISEIHTNLVPGACAGVPDWAIVSGASECLGAAYQGTYAVAGDTDNPTAGDPINTRTGGLSYLATDLTFPTLAGPLNFERWYASPTTGAYTEDLGFGWTHSLDSRLYFPDDPQGQEGAVLLKLHSANRYEFDIQSDGTYLPYPGACGALTRDDGPPTTYTFVDTAQQVYTFDETGRLQTLADPTGHLLHYVYGGDGRLSQVQDDGARFVSFSYDAQGRIEEVADHSGRGVSYTYDPTTGDLASATDVLGGTWTYEYDDAHRLTRIIDPTNSIVERTEYDDQGRVFRQFDGDGQLVVRLDYNADGTTTVTDVFGNQQTHQYDERGELTEQADALGSPMGRTYDGNFRPSSFTDPGGNTTELAWSGNGANLTQLADASGGTTRLSYDGLNNLTEVIDPAGGTSTFSYDSTLLTSLTDALGKTTTYTYTDAADDPAPPGLLETITDPLGNTTSFTYDALGQRASMTDALGQTSTYAYDDLGRLIEVTDPLERVTRRAYDFAGRLTRLVRNYSPLHAQNDEAQWNITTEFVYDAVGNMTETVDTFGRTTLYEYDETNHLIAVTDPAGKRTEFDLDEQGNLVGATDPLGRTTRYEYDALNRVIKIIDPLAGESLTAYDGIGNVSSSTDAAGNTTAFEYDELNRPVALVNALGGRTTIEYDPMGNVVAKTDAAGRTTTYAYDALSRLIRQTDPEGGTTQIFYDAAGNRERTIDPNGGVTRYEYDRLNRLVRVIDALGGETRYAYDAVGNQIAFTDANDHTTRYVYDRLNRTTEIQDPLDNITQTEYDALGNVLATLDALGNRSVYAYDLLNRLVGQTDPLDGHTTFSYDDVGNQLSFTDANGHTTTTVYDDLNRPVQTVDASGQISRATYDEIGNVLRLMDGLNQTTNFTYDDLRRQVSLTDPLGNETRYQYDEVGNQIGMTDAEGVVTRYEYDETNRLTAVVENYRPGFAPDSQTNVRTEYSYDANGNRLAVLDANGHTAAFDYDLLSRVVEERDALGNTTVYGYDPVGNRVSLTDATGFTTSYVYDEINRLAEIDYPEDDPDVQFTYDAVGNRKQMVDGLGTTTWAYDALHRPTAVTDPFGDLVSYAYDDVGNRTHLTYPDGMRVGFTYDASNRMIQVTDWDSLTTSYSYDLANRLIESSLPNGVISSYDYDAAGRLLEIEHRKATDLLSSFNYTYDGVGNRTQAVEVMSWPGEPMPVAYDVRPIPMAQAPVGPSRSSVPVDPLTAGLAPFGLLVLIPLMRRRELRHPHLVIVLVAIAGLSLAACTFPIPTPTPIPTGTPTATATFTATSTASPTDTATATFTPTDTATPTDTPTPTPEPLVVTTTTIDYAYDPLYRLVAANHSSDAFFEDAFFNYTYDAVGNRLTQETPAGTNTYSYDVANRLTSVDGQAYAWDANGNLLFDGFKTYTYDHANRLSSIVQGPDVYGFGYNGLGDRLQQTVNGATSNYTLDIEAGLTQVLSDGGTDFIYGVGRIAQQGAAGREYFLGDALNSARQLVNDAGRVGLGRAYEPFGDLLSIAGEIQTAYGFAGEWTDATGLINLRARYYQPTTGRFVQPDPFGGFPTRPVSLNAYPYAYDNPLLYTDASGRNPLLAAVIFGAALGGIIGFVGGGVFARLTYNWAYQRECGCAMQQWAHSIDGDQWVTKTAFLSGAIGFIAGGLAAAAPIGEIVVGLVGYAYATYDLTVLMTEIYTRWQATSEFGFTRCELLRFVVGVVGLIGGALLASKGFIDAQASGTVWSWEPHGEYPAIQPPTDRRGLRRAMGSPPSDLTNPQAHHNLPWRLREWFAGEGRGLSVNDPAYGRWVEGTPPGPHQTWSNEYDLAWQSFRDASPAASRNQVLAFLSELLSSGRFPSR